MPLLRALFTSCLLFAAFILTSCQQRQQQQQGVAAGDYLYYHFVPGKSTKLVNGKALIPKSAPYKVKRAIAAANRIAGLPYRRGGGHRRFKDTAYDCSGSASYVLREAGLLQGCLTSRTFSRYGVKGYGDWITVYHRDGHVFLVIAGMRFDTGYHSGESGPNWHVTRRKTRGFKVRHPAGY